MTILYIGYSGSGLRRALAAGHLTFEEADSLELLFCDTEAEALELEAKLIREHKPINNYQYANKSRVRLPEQYRTYPKRIVDWKSELWKEILARE